MVQEIRYSFIVPFYNRWDLTFARLHEFRKYLPDHCEIVLVDDCSTEEDVRKGVAFWQKSGISRHNILYKRNPENLGFSGSQNNGAKIATGNRLVFYSNDVVMNRDVTLELDAAYDLHDSSKFIIGDRLIYWDGGWNRFSTPSGDRIVPYLEGYFISCKDEYWKELEWDDRYRPYDYEDMDLSFQAQILGYNLIELKSNSIRHLGGQTIYKLNPQREKITTTNRLKFIEKWQSKLKDF